MRPEDVYINFVLHAVYGMLGAADLLFKKFPAEIRSVASMLFERHGVPCSVNNPIAWHRGVLVDPELGLDDKSPYPFCSWSEDPDVAKWFADRNSYISEPFRDYAPEARGYLQKLADPPNQGAEVLFHYSWRRAFGGVSIEHFAMLHPSMGYEGHRQIAWSLDHQREIITLPIPGIAAAPYEASPEETKRLDEKFTPSWIKEQRL